MSVMIELNEGTAGRRRVPCRLFTSNGTSPDTGATADAVIMGINSLTTISLTSTLRAVESAQGMYSIELTQSECSVLGNHPLYHTVGDFPQHIATVQVVNSNPFSSFSNIAAKVYSGVTVGAGDYAAKDMTSALTVGVGIAAPSLVTVRLSTMDYSSVVTMGVGIAKPSSISVRLESLDYASVVTVGVGAIKAAGYSGVSFEVATGGIQSSSFGAGAIDAAAIDAMNLSDLTVRVHPMAYSGLTVGIDNATGDVSSRFTVGVDDIKAGTYSGVTISGIQSAVSADVQRIRGLTEPAIRLLSHLSSVVTGQAVAGQLSTTTMTADVAEATNDHFNDRVIIWTSGVLAGQASSISDYAGASNGSSRLEFPAVTEAPTAGDEFVIV